MTLFTRLLNAVGLHTQAELDAARAAAPASCPCSRTEEAPQPSVRESPGEAEARRVVERIAAEYDGLPVALQVQAKAQGIGKLKKLVDGGRLEPPAFERWKRRLLML